VQFPDRSGAVSRLRRYRPRVLSSGDSADNGGEVRRPRRTHGVGVRHGRLELNPVLWTPDLSGESRS